MLNEDSERILELCNELLDKLKSLYDDQNSKSEIAHLRRVINGLINDNQRLHRENMLLKSTLK